MLRRGPTGLDGRPPRRHLVDYGNIEIAVKRKSQGSRNRSRRHHQHVRRRAFFHQTLALQNAKPVLLVDDHQAQAREFGRLFQ